MSTTVDIYRLRLSQGEQPIIYKWLATQKAADFYAKQAREQGWNVVCELVQFPTRKHSIVAMLTKLERLR